jgi:hypothetical protein
MGVLEEGTTLLMRRMESSGLILMTVLFGRSQGKASRAVVLIFFSTKEGTSDVNT